MLDGELGSEESQNESNGSSAVERAPGLVHKRIRMMSDSEPDSFLLVQHGNNDECCIIIITHTVPPTRTNQKI